MLTLLRQLIAHKGFATTALLEAIRQTPSAVDDAGIRRLLEHIRVSNRFWLLTILGTPFDHAVEGLASASFAALTERMGDLQRREEQWLASATEGDLERVLSDPLIPNGRCRVSEALIQVALHSQGHRSQCATLLRRAGGEPPVTDFITWVRPRADQPD